MSGGGSGALSPSPELLAKGKAKERELIKGLRDFFEQKGAHWEGGECGGGWSTSGAHRCRCIRGCCCWCPGAAAVGALGAAGVAADTHAAARVPMRRLACTAAGTAMPHLHRCWRCCPSAAAGVPFDEGWRVEVKIRLAGPALGTGEPGTRIDTVRWRCIGCCCTLLHSVRWLLQAATSGLAAAEPCGSKLQMGCRDAGRLEQFLLVLASQHMPPAAAPCWPEAHLAGCCCTAR